MKVKHTNMFSGPSIVKELERKIKHCEVNLPMHPSRVIDEGSYSVVYCHEVRGKEAAVKALRQQLPK